MSYTVPKTGTYEVNTIVNGQINTSTITQLPVGSTIDLSVVLLNIKSIKCGNVDQVCVDGIIQSRWNYEGYNYWRNK